VVPLLDTHVDAVRPPADLGARIRAAPRRSGAGRRGRRRPRCPPDADSARDPPSACGRCGCGPPTGRGLFRRPVWAAISLAAALHLVALGRLERPAAGSGQRPLDLSQRRGRAFSTEPPARAPSSRCSPARGPRPADPAGSRGGRRRRQRSRWLHELTPPGAQVYEAWAHQRAWVPRRCDRRGFHRRLVESAWFHDVPHTSLGRGVTVALTLEPGPGATTPRTRHRRRQAAAQSSSAGRLRPRGAGAWRRGPPRRATRGLEGASLLDAIVGEVRGPA
jgi:hypothetical protein